MKSDRIFNLFVRLSDASDEHQPRPHEPLLTSTAPPASCSCPVHLDCINLRPTTNPSPPSCMCVCVVRGLVCDHWSIHLFLLFSSVCTAVGWVCVCLWLGSRSDTPVCNHSAQRSCVRGQRVCGGQDTMVFGGDSGGRRGWGTFWCTCSKVYRLS